MGIAAAAAESQFHVLAVDDSLIERKCIERLLKTSSYQVTAVDSGSKALEFLGLNEDDQSNPNSPPVSPNNHQDVGVNLIITDYCMPGMTGYDLLKKIKESSSLKNIPVVIMSSENVPSRITRCLEEGAEEFFLKPVKPADLHRLKPHMMRTKIKNKEGRYQNNGDGDSDDRDQTVPGNRDSNDASYLPFPIFENKKQETPEEKKQETEKPEIPQQQQQTEPNNNNKKRKNIEEGLSPDRTRAR